MRRNKHGDEVRKGFFLAPVGGGVQDGLSALLPAPSSRCFHCELVSLTDLSCYLQNHFFFLETAEESVFQNTFVPLKLTYSVSLPLVSVSRPIPCYF